MLRGRLVAALSVVALGSCLAACGNRGVAEFQLYTQSFNLQYEQGDAVLNALANAERKVALSVIKARTRPDNFNPKQAAYYVENVDPPFTASIRASLKSVKTYNDALNGLTNGEAAEALTNRVGALTTNIVGAIAATQTAFGGPVATAAANTMVKDVASSLNLALPIFQQAATYASRESFRQQLIAAYPYMRGLVVTLRDGTPQMFEVMYRSHVQIGKLGVGRGGVSDAAAVEKERAMIAGWVVLLDNTLIAMKTAAAAAMSDVPSSDLASLSEASIELRVLAEKIKSARNKP